MNDLSFNQDFTCLSASSARAHRIFNCDPFGELHASSGELRHSEDTETHETSGTAFLRMLFSTSLIIVVPETRGTSPETGRRVLKMFNLKQKLKICELTFPSRILDVMLNRKRLAVFLESGQIYIYDLSSIRLLKVLDLQPFATSDAAKHTRGKGEEKGRRNTEGEGEPAGINLAGPAINHLNANTEQGTLTGLNKDAGSDCTSPVTRASNPGMTKSVVAALSADDRSLLVLPFSAVKESTDLFGGGNMSPDSPALSPVDHDFISGEPPSLQPYIELTHKNEQAANAKKPLHSWKDLQKDGGGWILVYDTIDFRPRLIYKAHDSPVAKIAISSDSSCIATASNKGTIVRVACIENEAANSAKLPISQITNLRRGHNPAKINALTFNLDSSILGCASESGTVHLFTLRNKASHFPPHETSADSQESADYHQNHELPEEEHSGRLSSSEDLNENLANLLLSNNTDNTESRNKGKESTSSYFSALKTSTKLINNSYTKSLAKRLPYKQYLENLVWEKPRRSFAYVNVPDAEGPQINASPKAVEIGFGAGGILILASYNTGKLYQYHMPSEDSEERTKCKLLSVNDLL